MELLIAFLVFGFLTLLYDIVFPDPKPKSKPKPKPSLKPKPSPKPTYKPKSKVLSNTELKRLYKKVPENPIPYANQFCSAEEKATHLKSTYWHNLKQKRLTFAKHKCEACGCSEFLYLHHVDYSNLLAEQFNDVAVLCYTCHQAIHDKLGYSRETYYGIDIK